MNVKLIKIIVVLLIAMLFTVGVVGADTTGDGNDEESHNTIESVNIIIKVPITGDTPDDKPSVTDNNIDTVNVVWSSNGGQENMETFSPNTKYTAKFTITAKEGYCFVDNTIVKINGNKIDNSEINVQVGKKSIIITHSFKPTEKETILSLEDITMPIPVAGKKPADFESLSKDKYNIYVDWVPGLTDGKFLPCTEYTAEFTITANEGYNFSDSTTVKMKFGSDSEATEYTKDGDNKLTISDDNNKLTFSHKFDKTKIETIDQVNIYISIPAPGVKPENPSSNEYKISIKWDPELNDGKFLPDKVYTAIFNITANDGYQFADSTTVKINDKNVDSFDLSVNKKLLNFTHKFEKTGTQTINSIKISNLDFPENGKNPDIDVDIDTPGIKYDVKWDIPDDKKFEFGKTYMVTINLTAKDGYLFPPNNGKPVVMINDTKVDLSGITFINENNISIKNNYTVRNASLPILNVTADVTDGKAPLNVTFRYDTKNAKTLTVNFDSKNSFIENNINEKDCGNISHIFEKNGVYEVIFYARNNDGVTTKKITISVSNIATSFDASPTSGTYPLTVTFTDTTDKSIKINSYYWDFGDGSDPVSGKDPRPYTYEKPGTYTVTHKVTDYYGNTASSTKTITVNQIESPLSEADDKSKNSGTQNGEPLLKLDASFPQPLGIIQELVKLFLSLFDLSTYGIE